MSILSAGACCCRSETIDGHFRRAPGICHCWSRLQVGLHTQHSSSACTGHHSAALQTFHLKNPPQWSVLMEHVPTGQPMAVHVEVCCFPVCCSSTAACQEVCQLACLLQPVSCLPRVLQPAKSSVSQSVRSVLRSWSSLPSVRQQPPIQATTPHAPVSAGLQAVRQQLHPDICLVSHPCLCSPAAGDHSFWQGRHCCRRCQQEEEERCVLIRLA